MSSNRTLLIVASVIVVVLLALGGFALWLFGGGTSATDERLPSASETGIVPVRVIDAYDGNRILKPVGIGVGSDGGFYVTLRDVPRIVEFDAQGNFVQSWGERGLEPGQVMVPIGVAVDRAGDRVYVTDRSRLRLICYTLDGEYRWEVPVLNPLAVALKDDGVIVTSFGPIALFDTEGVVQSEFGSRGEFDGQFDYPRGVVMVSDDSAIVADTNNARVQRIRLTGESTATVDWVVGRPPLNQDDASTEFGVPASVTLDDDGNLYLLDSFRAIVHVLDPATGEEIHRFSFATGSAPGRIYLPSGIAHLGGDTFAITDTGNDRIQVFRLLLPDENTIIARSPWLWALLLVPLLPFLLMLRRRRWFVTAETLERARVDGRLRLLAAVVKRMYVLPEVYEQYEDVSEEGVVLHPYFVPVSINEAAHEDAEATLADAAAPSVQQRLLFARHVVLCVDRQQADRFAQYGRRATTYEDLLSGYVLEGDAPAAD